MFFQGCAPTRVGGRPRKNGSPTEPFIDGPKLAELGIEKTLSHRWQKLASVKQKDLDKHKGGRPGKTPFPGKGVLDKTKLADLGIKAKRSHVWQKLASVKQKDLETYIAGVKDSRKDQGHLYPRSPDCQRALGPLGGSMATSGAQGLPWAIYGPANAKRPRKPSRPPGAFYCVGGSAGQPVGHLAPDLQAGVDKAPLRISLATVRGVI